jgi:tetratricopeptide (TPR) repeat protein
MAGRKRRGKRSFPKRSPERRDAAAVESSAPIDVPKHEAECAAPEACDDHATDQFPMMRVIAALAWLDGESLSEALRLLPLDEQRGLFRRYGIRVDPRYAKRVGALLRPHLRRTPPEELFQTLTPAIVSPLMSAFTEVLGTGWQEGIEDDAVPRLVDALMSSYPPGVVRLALAYEAFIDDESHGLAECLERDPEIGAHRASIERAAVAFFEGEPVPPPTRDESFIAIDSAADDPDPGEAEQATEVSEELFTPLDELVIRTAVATHTATVGAPDAEQLRLLVSELVHLNATRPSSYFHAGFLSALDPLVDDLEVAGMNEERWRWYRFGRLSGFVRRGQADLLREELLGHPEECLGAMRDPVMGASVTAAAVESLLDSHAELASQILSHRAERFNDDVRCCNRAYEQARSLLSRQSAVDAERLFASLAERSDFTPGIDRVDVKRRLASCRRALGDYTRALAILDEAEADARHIDPAASVRAVLAVERGLIDARVPYLSQLTFPRSASEVETVGGRVRLGEQSFSEALQHDPAEPRACYLLGLLAACDGDHEEGARLLELAESGMTGDEVFESSGVLAAVRYHRAVSSLMQLQPGTSPSSFDSLERALAEGYRPSGFEVRQAAEALAVHDSRNTGEFLRAAHERCDEPLGIASLVAERASKADRPAVEVAQVLANDKRLPLAERLELMIAAAEGGYRLGDSPLAVELAEKASDLVEQVGRADLDRAWVSLLECNEVLRDVLGALDADAERIEALRRLGDDAQACAAAEALFHRVANGSSAAFDPLDVLQMLSEVGGSAERLAELRRRFDASEPAGTLHAPWMDDRSVEVVFVGGNETQAQYQRAIDDELARKYGDGVTVHWHFPGWSSNWAKVADAAEAKLRDADVLVLMTLVRTNLGRRMRRRSGELGRPWVSCTGHGRAALVRAIERAMEVASLDEREAAS